MKKEEIAEKIIRDLLGLIPTYENPKGVTRFVNFEGEHENVGVTIKGYAIDHNIPPFNRKEGGLIGMD